MATLLVASSSLQCPACSSLSAGRIPSGFQKKVRQKSHKRDNSPIRFHRFFVFFCRLLLFFLLVLCDAAAPHAEEGAEADWRPQLP
jgi:hypothetical protein